MTNATISYLSVTDTTLEQSGVLISHLEIESDGVVEPPLPTGNSVYISYVAVDSPSAPSKIGTSIKAIASLLGKAIGIVVRPAIGPSVSIYPANGSTVRGAKVTISAAVTDAYYFISKVEIYIDNVLKVTDTGYPYQYVWSLKQYSKGSHTITVKAYNSGGYVTTANSTVRVA